MNDFVGAPFPIVRDPGLHAAQPNAAASEEMRRVAEEFEAVFLTEMLAPMFEGLDTEGLGGGGMGEQIFRPMLVERYAESITRAGGVGIADSIMRELMRIQGTVEPQEAPLGPSR